MRCATADSLPDRIVITRPLRILDMICILEFLRIAEKGCGENKIEVEEYSSGKGAILY
jgi:hypothetical protein